MNIVLERSLPANPSNGDWLVPTRCRSLPLQNASLAVDAAEGVARLVLEMTIDQRLRWLDEGAWGVHGTSISWR